MEAVVSRENMLPALRAVERNQGAAGVDGMTTGQLRGYLRQQWGQIKEQLLAGSYQPHLVRRVDIPKPGGGMRIFRIRFLLPWGRYSAGGFRIKINKTEIEVKSATVSSLVEISDDARLDHQMYVQEGVLPSAPSA